MFLAVKRLGRFVSIGLLALGDGDAFGLSLNDWLVVERLGRFVSIGLLALGVGDAFGLSLNDWLVVKRSVCRWVMATPLRTLRVGSGLRFVIQMVRAKPFLILENASQQMALIHSSLDEL